ncbi:hyaluronidase PH-20-like [Tenrec ecaudatus]|uniref:hyaluronidase PH-20-like n=1 Tax=Tenrec ecaudatus TaxID=94439 RepID=UPI003F597B02
MVKKGPVCTDKDRFRDKRQRDKVRGSPRIQTAGQRLVIFYPTKLGLYPFIYEKTRICVNGGLPQLGNLTGHLTKAEKDILNLVKANQTGLGVFDWEEWRLTWERNWHTKSLYRDLSIKLLQQQKGRLKLSEATKLAKQIFQTAAKTFYLETIQLAKRLRPEYLWGFYHFPECYNSNYTRADYDGRCYLTEKNRNDQLLWLWKESTALFPNIYLAYRLKSVPIGALFVRNRVQEAFRISALRDPDNPVPIYFYARPVYGDITYMYLPTYDLVNTLGECVALGVPGIVFWGGLNITRSKQACTVLSNYMTTTLNPYIINLTLAAKMCSQVLCQDNGVCTRKDWNSSDYLHLNPENFVIQIDDDGEFTVDGKPTMEDLKYFSEKFQCSCYKGYACMLVGNIEDTNLDDIKVCIANGAVESILAHRNFMYMTALS